MRIAIAAVVASVLIMVGYLGAPFGPVAIGAVGASVLLWWRYARGS